MREKKRFYSQMDQGGDGFFVVIAGLEKEILESNGCEKYYITYDVKSNVHYIITYE
jgi:hypothetical protein